MMTSGDNENSWSYVLLTQIQCQHTVERCLCDQLESIADALPEIDQTTFTVAAGILRACLGRHIALEERYLLPMLMTRAQDGDNIKALRAQIAAEHASDEALAHDIADELERGVEIGRVRNPEMLGYMLHGFFECRRRHLAWENAVVLPLALRRLRESDWRTFPPPEAESVVNNPDFRPRRV